MSSTSNYWKYNKPSKRIKKPKKPKKEIIGTYPVFVGPYSPRKPLIDVYLVDNKRIKVEWHKGKIKPQYKLPKKKNRNVFERTYYS